MLVNDKVLVGKSNDKELSILLNKANRHGLITGASGSGKTITLKVMAESFASAGVPVFLADVKGDLTGMCEEGIGNEKIEERLNGLKLENFDFKKFPTRFWDVYGRVGHPLRTTIHDVGTIILARMLGLNETQEGVLAIAFKIAREKELPLDDLKDLRMLLQYIADHKSELTITYGNVTPASIGSIQRGLLMLEEQGAEEFFAMPSLDIKDFIKRNDSDIGYINVLNAAELYKKPTLYACFMLWLLNHLNQTMEEVGDLDKPKLVFFFDEAHLLFDNMPSYMLESVIQVVKLIRSKGIGLYFISQSPSDIPGPILEQLGNVVQHTLRAYTPSEQKVVKAAAASFRPNPAFSTEEAIMSLGTGEAVVSFVNEKGEPGICEKVTILPPQSKMGGADPIRILDVINNSELSSKYESTVDRESAYEILTKQIEEEKERQAEIERQKEEEKQEALRLKEEEKQRKEAEKLASKPAKKSGAQKALERGVNSAMSSIGRQIGNSIFKGIFKK